MGDRQERTGLGLILGQERAEGHPLRQWPALYEVMVRRGSIRKHLRVGDRGRQRAVVVLFCVVPVVLRPDGFSTRLLEGVGFDDEVLIHGQEVLTLDDELGHRGFSYLMLFKTTTPLPAEGGAVAKGSSIARPGAPSRPSRHCRAPT